MMKSNDNQKASNSSESNIEAPLPDDLLDRISLIDLSKAKYDQGHNLMMYLLTARLPIKAPEEFKEKERLCALQQQKLILQQRIQQEQQEIHFLEQESPK